MKLNFLGRGSAFNQIEGNNSAYFIDDNQLFLIDCGENIFGRIIENKLLDNIEVINLLITHTHSDHIGSIGSLVHYCFYVLHKPVNIILPVGAKYLSSIEDILNGFGCRREMYNYIFEEELDSNCKSFQKVRYIETTHCEELNWYSLIFYISNGIVYYSGDTNETTTLKKIIDSGHKIDKLYIDTTSVDVPNNAHLYIGVLKKVIPNELKSKVYCMHLNSDDCIRQAEMLGYNVVEIDK